MIARRGRLDRVMVTGGKGNANPYFQAMLDLATAAPGQMYLFDTGYCKLATYDAIRAHGSDLVSILHKNILYHAGGAWSLTALQRQPKRALHDALFAAEVVEGERRAHERGALLDAGLPLLREAG